MHRSIPKAKKHCFSAKSDSRTGITRRSDGLRRCNRGSTKFNTFAESIFLRLPRSCRVAEKSDPINRFSGPDLQKITKNRWFLSNFSTTRHDRAKQKNYSVANVSKRRLPNPHPPRLTKHFYCFDLTSRKPKNTVFQQNPTLVHSQLDSPLDSDAKNAAAQASIHLLGGFFAVCRDLVALRRNLIRSIASRDPICLKS